MKDMGSQTTLEPSTNRGTQASVLMKTSETQIQDPFKANPGLSSDAGTQTML